jgi:hypothetical protein
MHWVVGPGLTWFPREQGARAVDGWHRAGALQLRVCMSFFFQGDDSLSAIAFDSDFETVSAVGWQRPRGLSVPLDEETRPLSRLERQMQILSVLGAARAGGAGRSGRGALWSPC